MKPFTSFRAVLRTGLLRQLHYVQLPRNDRGKSGANAKRLVNLLTPDGLSIDKPSERKEIT